jgi:hypothetical protein
MYNSLTAKVKVEPHKTILIANKLSDYVLVLPFSFIAASEQNRSIILFGLASLLSNGIIFH